jgi:hypothetical protein
MSSLFYAPATPPQFIPPCVRYYHDNQPPSFHPLFFILPLRPVYSVLLEYRSRYIAQPRHRCAIYRATYIPSSTLPFSRFHLFIYHTSIPLFILHFISFLVYASRSVGHMSVSASSRILILIVPRGCQPTVRHYMRT